LNNTELQDKNFSQDISTWYLSLGRNSLPWRKNISPYRIWISEIMLQQTQVKTVIPFFNNFIKTYPNLKSIASASEDDVLALWSGLGFYRRAKNIYKAKEIIKKEFGNRFPKTFEELLHLPGIGRSTAGAIMSIAYQKSYPILDANVKRVISRYKDINVNDKDSIKKLWSLSEELTPEKNIFEYTQGIMDLGATVCTSKSQNCSKCPLNYDCKNAYKDFQFESKLRKDKPKKKIYFTLARTKESFLLFKKNEKSFWESLWVPYNSDHHEKNILFKEPDKREVTTIRHLLSHLELEITIEIFNYKTPFKIKSNLEHQWINKDQIHKYGLPKPIKTIIDDNVY
jgi:A/G-specific adenine glycosylase